MFVLLSLLFFLPCLNENMMTAGGACFHVARPRPLSMSMQPQYVQVALLSRKGGEEDPSGSSGIVGDLEMKFHHPRY